MWSFNQKNKTPILQPKKQNTCLGWVLDLYPYFKRQPSYNTIIWVQNQTSYSALICILWDIDLKFFNACKSSNNRWKNALQRITQYVWFRRKLVARYELRFRLNGEILLNRAHKDSLLTLAFTATGYRILLEFRNTSGMVYFLQRSQVYIQFNILKKRWLGNHSPYVYILWCFFCLH